MKAFELLGIQESIIDQEDLIRRLGIREKGIG